MATATAIDDLFLHNIINIMVNKELKWAINTRTGLKRQLPPSIYNNPFRMKSRDWQLIETPPHEETETFEPVGVNIPGQENSGLIPEPEITADYSEKSQEPEPQTEYEVPVYTESSEPEAPQQKPEKKSSIKPKPKSKNK